MKNLFFTMLYIISLFTFNTHIFAAEKENIATLQERYFKIREVRDETFLPETLQAFNDLQVNPDCSDLQDAFKRSKDRLNACNEAMLKLRTQAFPKEVIFIPKD